MVTPRVAEAAPTPHRPNTSHLQRKRVRAWDCTRCGGATSTFALHKLVFVEDWDLTAMVGHWPLLDAVVVTFRGTDSHNLGNWITDMDMRMSDYPVPHPRAQQQQYSPPGEPLPPVIHILSSPTPCSLVVLKHVRRHPPSRAIDASCSRRAP